MTRQAGSQTVAEQELILAADVGGTNTRLALADKSSVLEASALRFQNRDFSGLDAAIRRFLRESGWPVLAGACIAVAGPVLNNRVRLTNIDWEVDAAVLSRDLGGIRVSVINDLQAIGHALHLLKRNDLQELIQSRGNKLENPRLVINAGTGFNAVAVHAAGNGRFIAPSECGHAGLPFISDETLKLQRHIQFRQGFASIEDVLSGRGAELVRNWVTDSGKSPAEKSSADYHRIMATTLGAVARDLALTHLPFGGIYLTGGLIRAIAPQLKNHGFSTAFISAGRFSDFMRQFSVHLICDDMAALRGCVADFDSFCTVSSSRRSGR